MTREEYKKWLAAEQARWRNKSARGTFRSKFSPSAPAELSEADYRSWLEDTDKPWEHTQITGGRLKLRFSDEDVPLPSRNTRERLSSGWQPPAARTQSLAVYAVSRERERAKESKESRRKERILQAEKDISAALKKYRDFYLSEQKKKALTPFESSTKIPSDPDILIQFGMPKDAAEHLSRVAAGRVFLSRPERPEASRATTRTVAVAASLYRFFGTPFSWDRNSPPFALSLKFTRNIRGLRADPKLIQFLKDNASEALYTTLYLTSVGINGSPLGAGFASTLRQKAILMAGSPPPEHTDEWLPVVPLAFMTLVAQRVGAYRGKIALNMEFKLATTGTKVSFDVPLQHLKSDQKNDDTRPMDYESLRYAYYEDLPSLLARGLNKRRYQKRSRTPFHPNSSFARENPVQIVVDYSQYADLAPESYREIPSKPSYGVYKNAKGELQVASIKRIKTWLNIAGYGKERKENKGSPGALNSVHLSEKNPMAGRKLSKLRAEFGPTARLASQSNATRYRMRQHGFDPLAELSSEFGPKARLVDPSAGRDPMAAARAALDYKARAEVRRSSLQDEFGPTARVSRSVPSGPYLPFRPGRDADPYMSAVGSFGLQQFVPVNRRSNPDKTKLTRKQRSQMHNAQSHSSELAATAMRIKHSQGVSLKEAWRIARSTGARQAVANPTYFPGLYAMGMTGALGQQAAHPVSRRNTGKARPNIGKCAKMAQNNPNPAADSMMEDLIAKGYATKGDVRAMRELCGAASGSSGSSRSSSRPSARATRSAGGRASSRTGRMMPRGGGRRR